MNNLTMACTIDNIDVKCDIICNEICDKIAFMLNIAIVYNVFISICLFGAFKTRKINERNKKTENAQIQTDEQCYYNYNIVIEPDQSMDLITMV
jgi:hypothetical protein